MAHSTPLSAPLPSQAIVAAAARVFARDGFAATRVEDILEASGVARRTFYKYFTGKDDVLAAVYGVATAELLERVSTLRARDPFDLFRYGLDLYLGYLAEHGPLVKVLVEQAIRSDSPLAEARRGFRTAVVSLMERKIREWCGKAEDPMVYAALFSALEGLSLDVLESPPVDRAAVRRVRRAMLTLLGPIERAAREHEGR